MHIFELYFNPKEESKIAESFKYKPKDAYERKLGRIYMVGEISNPEKKDSSLLQNIFYIAKETYYKDTSLSSESALKKTLKEINEFIRERKYSGKLDIVLLVAKNFHIYLGKIGAAKIFLLNEKSIKDISKEIEDSQGNLFSNMISGKIKRNDKLAILTSTVYRFFEKGKLLPEIAKKSFNENVAEKISSLQKEKFSDISGIAFILDRKFLLADKNQKIVSRKRKKRFSFKDMFSENVSSLRDKFPQSKIKTPLNIGHKIKTIFPERKNLFLPFLLLGVVILGSIIIGIEKNARKINEKEKISTIEENFLEAKKRNNIPLMTNALLELEDLIEKSHLEEELQEKYIFFKNELLHISSFKKIEDINFIKEVEDFSPEKIILVGDEIYLFSSSSPLLGIMNIPQKTVLSQSLLEKGAELGSSSEEKIYLFSSPNTLFKIEKGDLSSLSLDLSTTEKKFVALSSYLGKPYFLNEEGEIFSSSDVNLLKWTKEKENKKSISMAIDGSIFVLGEKNTIHRYYKGVKEEKIEPTLFPPLLNPKKICTAKNNPLFILDPQEMRIVVLEKNGEIIEQLYHESFEKVQDMAVSADGKKIYLLIGKKVYFIEREN